MSDLHRRIQSLSAPLQLAVLSTLTEDGKPWCRYVMIQGDAAGVLRCATHTGARKVRQIAACPDVHLTLGVTNPADMKPYLQIQAQAQLTTELAARQAFWNPTLEPIFSGPDDPAYGVLVFTPYRVEFCTPGSPQPEVWSA